MRWQAIFVLLVVACHSEAPVEPVAEKSSPTPEAMPSGAFSIELATKSLVRGVRIPVRALLGPRSRDVTADADWDIADQSLLRVDCVDSQCWVVALKEGRTQVTATYEKTSARVDLQVSKVVSLAVKPAETIVELGTLQALHAIATLSDGTELDLTTDVAWSSSYAELVDVRDGRLQTRGATGADPVIISAKTEGASATSSVRVTLSGRQAQDLARGTSLEAEVNTLNRRQVAPPGAAPAPPPSPVEVAAPQEDSRPQPLIKYSRDGEIPNPNELNIAHHPKEIRAPKPPEPSAGYR